MAKTEQQGRQFTKCEAFWEAEQGESFTGVLVDCNEKFPDKIKGDKATKPLYILKSIGEKAEKPSLSLDDKKVPNRRGLLVGIFDSQDLRDKIFDHYEELLGKELTITFVSKEDFENSSGAKRSIKRFKVLKEDTAHAEFAPFVVHRKLAVAPASPAQEDTGPYRVDGSGAGKIDGARG